jgi:hypothetical protein
MCHATDEDGIHHHEACRTSSPLYPEHIQLFSENEFQRSAVVLFQDRSEAGRLLADRLRKYQNQPDVLVLALPRGGVPVAESQPTTSSSLSRMPASSRMRRNITASCSEATWLPGICAIVT